ncbi:MAG TPA: FUSC family protein, partial [Rhodopila sp.]|nr:FUSC family protein [Rhodopila sp.]
LTRVEEIGIGITVATLVAQVIFPRPVGPALAMRIDAWIGNAKAWATDALLSRPTTGEDVRRLAADAVEIDTLSGHLGFDATPWQTQCFALLRERMVMLLPILSSIADRTAGLREPDARMPPEATALASDLCAWITHPVLPAETMLSRIDRLEAAAGHRTDWSGLLLGNLLTRMRELVQVLDDCAVLRRLMGTEAGTMPKLSFAPEGTAARAWHRDPGMALLSAVAAVLAVLLVCVAWIATAWPDGFVAAEMVAVACSFFAAQDDPVPAIMVFLIWSVVAVIADGILLFGMLPAATSFGALALVLAPFYLIGGVLVSMPATASGGRAFTANGATMLALQGTYTGDLPGFVNSGAAFILGLAIAAVVTRLVRSVGAEFSAGRLLRGIWLDLAVAAERRGNRDRGRYVGLMLDRLGLVAPRLAEGDARSVPVAAEALADIRIGLNIIDLRRSRHNLDAPARAVIDAMLDTLAADYRARAGQAAGHVGGPVAGQATGQAPVQEKGQMADAVSGSSPRARLLGCIDAALRQVALVPPCQGRADALLGLIGIRRGLFPQAGAVEVPPA